MAGNWLYKYLEGSVAYSLRVDTLPAHPVTFRRRNMFFQQNRIAAMTEINADAIQLVKKAAKERDFSRADRESPSVFPD